MRPRLVTKTGWLLSSLLLLFLPALGYAQQAVLQGGSVTRGHIPTYSSQGTGQPIVIDSGPAGGNVTGQGISELNVTARGTGTAPYAGQGTGPNGEIVCLQDAVSTNSTGYHYLCLSANAQGGGLLSYGAAGGASTLPLNFIINGATYGFPFSDGFVVGPNSSTVNNVACWNNTSGTLLKDCGAIPSTTPGGSSGQVQYNNAGSFGGFTVSGDGTLNTGTGALTVTKINNVTVSLGGTLTTAAAFTQAGAFATTLTSVGATNVTLPQTGTLATLAGSEALTNKSYNGMTLTPSTGTFSLTNGKTFSVTNTLTLSGTDSSTLNIGTGGTLGTAAFTASSAYVPAGTQITNALGADVNLNNTGTYFDGPSIAQGSTGTWFACGQVLVGDTTGGAMIDVKLWDGTTVIASGGTNTSAAGGVGGGWNTVSLCGYITSPAGNIRMSAKDIGSTNGVMKFNFTGLSKDSTVSAFRVN